MEESYGDDDEDDDSGDILLPDKSNPHSDPLNLVLSANCIKGSFPCLVNLTFFLKQSGWGFQLLVFNIYCKAKILAIKLPYRENVGNKIASTLKCEQ